MMKRWTVVAMLAGAVLQGLAQDDAKQSLIVVHVDPASGNQFKQQIFAYHFLNGSFTGRNELMTVAGRKDGKDYIRTDIGNNLLYKDRYLVTGIGNIIDLQEKKVLFDGRANLVRCSNDSAVFYTNDIFKGKFYSVYDFKKGQYEEVKDLLFKPRVDQDVEFDKTTTPFALNYYPQGKPKVTLTADAGFGQQGTGDAHVPDPPLFWLDATTFVFAYFNKDNTELLFYKMNIQRPNDKKLLGKVPMKTEKQLLDIGRLNEHTLLAKLGDHQIVIDLKAETATELDFSKPANGFAYECKNNAAGRVVKLNGKEVGKFHFRPATFKTGSNIAALVKEITVGPESYQQGISVWNNSSKSWASVDSEDVLVMAGWINK